MLQYQYKHEPAVRTVPPRKIPPAQNAAVKGRCEMKKTIAILLTVVMLFGLAPVSELAKLDLPAFPIRAEALSGSCGAHVSWKLDSDGVLTITGTGAMTDYEQTGEHISPFNASSSVKKLVIENGVTGVGKCAFYNCASLTEATLPDSLTTIGVVHLLQVVDGQRSVALVVGSKGYRH